VSNIRHLEAQPSQSLFSSKEPNDELLCGRLLQESDCSVLKGFLLTSPAPELYSVRHAYYFDILGHYFIWQLLVITSHHYSVAYVGGWMSGLFY
jgi:hypothetical protein